MVRRWLCWIVLLGMLSACGGAAPSTNVGVNVDQGATDAPASATDATAPGTAAPDSELEALTVGLGYIPNVQFAPFYVAVAKGYYQEAGFEVEFKHGNVNDLLVETASGKLPFVLAAGDEVLLARVQQVPVKMVFLLFQRVPVAVFSKASANIQAPADLKGKTIGLPGKYGATYVGLRALLYANDLTEEDVQLSEIGFAQFEAVSQDTVPVAVGYANNEPLRLQESGVPVNVIKIADHLQLVSNGLVLNESYARDHAAKVRRFLDATRRGLEDTLADPESAFEMSLPFIPELAPDQQPFQRKVLLETINYWRPAEGVAPGGMDAEAWRETYTFLRESGILTRDLDPETAYTMEFLR